MIGVFYLVSAILIMYFVFLPFQAVGGKLFGAVVTEIGLFVSPKIFQFNVGSIKFKLNALPFCSYVKFSDDFEFVQPFKKILILSAGLLSYLVVAFIGLGFTETFQQTFSGFTQIFKGLYSPLVIGSAYLEKLTGIMTQSSFLVGLGILACKMLAFNLLPFGGLAGGNLLIYILEMFGLKSQKFVEKYQLFTLVFVLILNLAYLIAFIVFAMNRFKFN